MRYSYAAVMALCVVAGSCAEHLPTVSQAKPSSATAQLRTSTTDGRSYWRGLSDSAVWMALGPTRIANVGIRSPAADRGVERGKVVVSRSEKVAGETAVIGQPGVTLIDRDARLPIVRVRILDIDALRRLRRLPHVDYLEPDRMAAPPGGILQDVCGGSGYGGTAFNTITPGDTFGIRLDNHHLESAWFNSNSGAGITVGLLDSGLDPNQQQLNLEFDAGMSSGRSLARVYTFGGSPNDECGHGTHMAGIIAAPRDGKNVVGIAWRAHLISVRVTDAPFIGEGNATAVRNAIALVGPHAQIILMGFATIYNLPSISDEIDIWYYGSGRMFVAPGGQGDPLVQGVLFPANLPTVVGVSGTSDGDSCPSCIYGPEIDFEAFSGNPTTGAFQPGNPPIQTSNLSSGASAILTGIAAVVWSKNPTWTRQQVLDKLAQCSHYFPNRNPNRGWGFTDAGCAVATPSPYFANVSGPSEIRPQNTCYWSVDTNVPDPMFEWQVNGTVVGTDAQLFYSHPNGPDEFEVYVSVTSATGPATASGGTLVTVSWAYGPCS